MTRLLVPNPGRCLNMRAAGRGKQRSASRLRWRSASMKRRRAEQLLKGAFDIVRTVGLALPDVEATTKYDGSPVLKVDGMFMAGLATHQSAEPDTLVVRAGLEDRERLVEDAPEIYYLSKLSPSSG